MSFVWLSEHICVVLVPFSCQGKCLNIKSTLHSLIVLAFKEHVFLLSLLQYDDKTFPQYCHDMHIYILRCCFLFGRIDVN